MLLFRFQESSIVLNSFTFGLFLPFITEDLHLSPLEAGLLQGVWWVTSALLTLPFGTWFSRFRPVPLVLASLVLGLPFIFLQGAALNFLMLFFARFFLVMFHVINAPARSMMLQQWAARRQYALINAVGLCQHSILLATAVSTSTLLIAAVGSWRLAYLVLGGFILLQTIVWTVVAREQYAPVKDLQTALREQMENPLRAIRSYPQVWLLGITMFALGATWTAVVTFMPTFMPGGARHPPGPGRTCAWLLVLHAHSQRAGGGLPFTEIAKSQTAVVDSRAAEHALWPGRGAGTSPGGNHGVHRRNWNGVDVLPGIAGCCPSSFQEYARERWR